MAKREIPFLDTGCDLRDFEANFKVYHDLMRFKVYEVLLVLTPYDAFILEEDGSFASRVINQYHGLNLSDPPRFSRVASGREALELVRGRRFDLVITLPRVADMDGFALGRQIKMARPHLPVVVLGHRLSDIMLPAGGERSGIDDLFVWTHDPDLLLALIKQVEDRLNASHDTELAMVRVLLLVEDSPEYRSFFLPLIYREVMAQTQAVLDESLTDEHRLLKMRARPKILVAENYEAALNICRRYRTYLHGVISDTSFPRQGEEDPGAGLRLFRQLRKDHPDLPLLLLSTESGHREEARKIPAVFAAKEEEGELARALHEFFLNQLGFGDFVFRRPGGEVLGRAGSLHRFERMVAEIPEDCLLFHARRNHFSNWIMARSEVTVASKLRDQQVDNFPDVPAVRHYLVECIRSLRRHRQQGVAVPFPEDDFDAGVMDFVTIGSGIMGGKGIGLAFMARFLRESGDLCQGKKIGLAIPRTYVITTSYFDEFIETRNLRWFREGRTDKEIAAAFLAAPLPGGLVAILKKLLDQVDFPLTVRSSSIMEDVRLQPYAGLFDTYMLANNHPDPGLRLNQLQDAVRLVYASAFFRGPRAFARAVRQEGKDGMGVIIQELVGETYGDYFYPALSGVAMSRNFYPVEPMKPEDGVVQLALGFGKGVVEGEKCLRFSPNHPQSLPQFSTVEDILANSQPSFYALKIAPRDLAPAWTEGNLVRRSVSEAAAEGVVEQLTSAYLPEEGRIRDGVPGGTRLLTFANLLKYDRGLAGRLNDLLELGQRGMGGEVEIEFAGMVDRAGMPETLYILQIRPMAVGDGEQFEVEITAAESERAICTSAEALGHGVKRQIADIVYTRPERFDPAGSVEIARQISELNGRLLREGRPYLLAGYGRWGCRDHWLGIPVAWADIAGVGAVIELRGEKLRVEGSQGTHFFQNITSLSIPYLTVDEERDCFDWEWLEKQPALTETSFLRLVRLKRPLVIKIDGRDNRGVIYPGS